MRKNYNSNYKPLKFPKSKFISNNYDLLNLADIKNIAGEKNFVLKFFFIVVIKLIAISVGVNSVISFNDLNKVYQIKKINELKWAENLGITKEYFKQILNLISLFKTQRDGMLNEYPVISIERSRSANIDTTITIYNACLYFFKHHLNKQVQDNILIPINILQIAAKYCTKEYSFFYLIELYRTVHVHCFFNTKDNLNKKYNENSVLKNLSKLYPRIKNRSITVETIKETVQINEVNLIMDQAESDALLHLEAKFTSFKEANNFQQKDCSSNNEDFKSNNEDLKSNINNVIEMLNLLKKDTYLNSK